MDSIEILKQKLKAYEEEELQKWTVIYESPNFNKKGSEENVKKDNNNYLHGSKI